MKHPVLIVSVVLVVLLAMAQPGAAFQPKDSAKAQTATTNHADKIRKKVRKVGTRGKITVELNSTREYHGTIKWIDEDGFQIDEVDLNQVVSVNYNDVKRVDSGYTRRGIAGNRVTEHTRTIVLVVVLGAAVVGAVLAGKALR